MDDGNDSQTIRYYTTLILDAIAKLKKQRKRPSGKEICRVLRSHPDVPNNATAKCQIQRAVADGSVLPVVKNGKKSYLDPAKVSQLKKTRLYITPTMNLMKIVVHCIQNHREANGCTLDTIEQTIRTKYGGCVLKHANLSRMLESQAHQSVRDGLLQQEGDSFRVRLVTSARRKAGPHSKTKKSRLTSDEEDTEARPSKASPPSERNQPTLESNPRSTHYRQEMDYAESSAEHNQESPFSSDAIVTESSDSDQDSDGPDSEDEQRSEENAEPLQFSEDEDEIGHITSCFKRNKEGGYTIEARNLQRNTSDSVVSNTDYEHHRHTNKNDAFIKKTLENPDCAVPSTSYGLKEAAVQHERNNGCRPASKSRLSAADHQRPTSPQAMEPIGIQCDDHGRPMVGQTESVASVEQLEADDPHALGGPSGASSTSSSGDGDAQLLQHGRNRSASGATTASSRKRPADLSTTVGNGTTGRVENESHSTVYAEYLASKIRKNNLTSEKLQKEIDSLEETRRRETEKEEREKKQHDLNIKKMQREIKLVDHMIKRQQEKTEEEKERRRKMGEMCRRETEESRARQAWYESTSQHFLDQFQGGESNDGSALTKRK